MSKTTRELNMDLIFDYDIPLSVDSCVDLCKMQGFRCIYNKTTKLDDNLYRCVSTFEMLDLDELNYESSPSLLDGFYQCSYDDDIVYDIVLSRACFSETLNCALNIGNCANCEGGNIMINGNKIYVTIYCSITERGTLEVTEIKNNSDEVCILIEQNPDEGNSLTEDDCYEYVANHFEIGDFGYQDRRIMMIDDNRAIVYVKRV